MTDQPGNPASSARRPYLPDGFTALRAGDLSKAMDICKAALSASPDLARAHFLAALIALASGDRSTALSALETTVKLNDKHSAAWAHLAEIYVTSGRLRLAEASLRNAVNTDRGRGGTRDLIGTIFRFAGNLDASLEWHEKAVESEPDDVGYKVNLANACLFLGDRERARTLLSQCLQQEPHNAQVHWLCSRATDAIDVSHIVTMTRQLDDRLPEQSVAYLQYAIGKEREDLGDWEDAFDAWTAGAAAKRKLVSFDESREIQLFETLKEVFTSDWLEQQTGGCFDAGPVFIVGQPRTGTTLLDRMLDAHPAVTSAGELRHIGYAIRQVTGSTESLQFSSRLMRAAAAADVTAIGEAYIDITSNLRLGAAHIIDKLPSNYLHLPLILAALPNARIIHVRRDPMDTCLAIYKQLFADAYLYSYDIGELARHLGRYLDLMQTWRDRFGDRFIEVDYEALVGDTEESLRRLLQFIGLSWNPACLEYFKHDSAVTTASAHQVRQAPYQRSVGHWKNFARQLQPALEILSSGEAE